MRDEVRNSSLFNPQCIESGPANFTSARSLVMPSTTPIGSSIGIKTLDKDGWAMAESRAGTAKAQNKDGPATGTFTKAGASKLPTPGYTSSSFMDEYRQSKNHLAHKGMTMNGLLGRPIKAGLNSFQNENAESLKGFMDLLPANSSQKGSTSKWQQAPTSSSRSSGKQFTLPTKNKLKAGDGSSSDTNNTAPRKRLGSGRPRKR